jgi:hypothetical protein
VPTFLVLKAVKYKVVKMLKKRLNANIYEKYYSPYRNFWFLMKKKIPGLFKIINTAIYINRVILKDANIFLNVEEFAEEFAEMAV